MVTISIFIEGGNPNLNSSAATNNNSTKLRESFNSIFSQIISPSNYNLKIKMSGGIAGTVKKYKLEIKKDKNALLLIDLDDIKDQKENEEKIWKIKRWC